MAWRIWRAGSTIPLLMYPPMTFWCCRMQARKVRRECLRLAICPIPKKLAQAGVKDLVRISDARMSGTAFGTIVLHITPEAAAVARWR